MKWSEDKVLRLAKLKKGGWSDRDIAAVLDVKPQGVRDIVWRKRLVKSSARAEEFRLENSKIAMQQNHQRRYWDFVHKFGETRGAGWLVGLLCLSENSIEDRRIRLTTQDKGLIKKFKDVVRSISKSKIEISKEIFFEKRHGIYTMLRVADVLLTEFIKKAGESFCKRWMGVRIRECELEFYRGLLQGVFDARATLEPGARRVDAVRLYTRRLLPGAVRNIRWALKRFGIKYGMQGGLTQNERKFYKTVERKLRKLERSGFPERLGKMYLKRNFMYKDYDKREMRFNSVPAIKIKNRADNLRKFAKIINFRRSDLKAALPKLRAKVAKLKRWDSLTRTFIPIRDS